MSKNRFRSLLFALAAGVPLILAGSAMAQHQHSMTQRDEGMAGMTQQDRGQALKVGKKGEITFSEETRAGDVTLKPGRYTIQHRVEGEDHFIHFTQVTERVPGYAIGGGVPVAHPGEVKCRLEPLQTKAPRTTVYTNTDGGVRRITKIIVAGENVAHLL